MNLTVWTQRLAPLVPFLFEAFLLGRETIYYYFLKNVLSLAWMKNEGRRDIDFQGYFLRSSLHWGESGEHLFTIAFLQCGVFFFLVANFEASFLPPPCIFMIFRLMVEK